MNPEKTDHLLSLTIRSGEGLQFDDKVKAVTSDNETGKFDILPFHANFITLIKHFITIHKKDGADQQMTIDSGLLRVAADKVDIYLGVGNSSLTPTTSINPPA